MEQVERAGSGGDVRADGEPLRILLSSYYYPPSLGGVERQTQHLVRGLAQRGHHVRVIAARLAGGREHEQEGSIEITRIAPGSGSRWRKMGTYLAGLSHELWRARGWADLVQVQQALYPAAAASLATRLLGLPLVVSNRGSGTAGAVKMMSGLPLGALSLRAIGARAFCIGNSAESVAEMRALGFERTERIANGVDLPELDEAQRAQARRELGVEGLCALFVGRLEPEKDLPPLVQAFAAQPHAKATLVLVGDGSERARLEALVQSTCPGRVRFAGASSDPSVWLRAADLFVLPSKSEGMSNALLEAMAHGLPVLASDIAGNREVIDRPEVGRLFPLGSVAQLAALLDQLFGDAQLRARLGHAAREHMQRNFSIDAMVDAHQRLYRSLLQ
jgi:glycosyltransferase involved in cell wall biosynthesis